MKAFLAAMFMFVLGDFAVNHGDGTHQVVALSRHFLSSVVSAGAESIFNR